MPMPQSLTGYSWHADARKCWSSGGVPMSLRLAGDSWHADAKKGHAGPARLANANRTSGHANAKTISEFKLACQRADGPSWQAKCQ